MLLLTVCELFDTQVDSVRDILKSVEEQANEALTAGPIKFANVSGELRSRVEQAGEQFLKCVFLLENSFSEKLRVILWLLVDWRSM